MKKLWYVKSPEFHSIFFLIQQNFDPKAAAENPFENQCKAPKIESQTNEEKEVDFGVKNTIVRIHFFFMKNL